MTLVGNKSDLQPDMHQVTSDEGKKMAEEFKCAWIEASARNDTNVVKAFEILVGEIEKSQNPSQPTGGPNKCIVM